MKVTLRLGNTEHIVWMGTTYYGVISEVRGSTFSDRWKIAWLYWGLLGFGKALHPVRALIKVWRIIRQRPDFDFPTGSSRFNQYAMMRAIRFWLEAGYTGITLYWSDQNPDEDWRVFVKEWDEGKDPPEWYRDWREERELWESLGIPALEWKWENAKWKAYPVETADGESPDREETV